MKLRNITSAITLLALSVLPFTLPLNIQSNIKIFFLDKARPALKSIAFISKEKSPKKQIIIQANPVELEELRKENERLRSLLDFKQGSERRLISAFVIGRDPSNWSHSIIIDRGSADGIRPDMAVITKEALIGKIVEVGKNTSRAILITDRNFKAAALVERTRVTGLLSGFSPNRCQMRFIPLDADVEKGDIVISLGGGVFPKGLLIGKIVNLGLSGDSVSRFAIIESPVRLNQLEEVFIINERAN